MQVRIAWDGVSLSLAHIGPLAAAPEGTNGRRAEGSDVGFWVDLRAADGTILGQRSLANALGTRFETLLDDGGVAWEQRCPYEQAWVNVTLPNDPSGTELWVHSSPFEPERANEPAELVAKLALPARP